MQVKELIQKMTLEEKAAILSGASEWETHSIEHLGIPAIFFADGPHGLRKQEGAGDHLGLNASLPATCFPTSATIANSWDEQLGEAVGQALGEEAAAMGVDVLLGPGLNIKRSPLCGRNFEYFSEDPYLAGKLAAAYIRGIQSQGVYACPKHFAVNSQEFRRMAMNAVIDERTLREIYLTGFEIAIKEGGAGALMTSYNEVNGTYANENRHLLQDILRGEWGYEGMVVTDWGGSNDHVAAVKCRANLEMPTPGYDSARQILEAVKKEELTLEELDTCVEDLLKAVKPLENGRKQRKPDFDRQAHHELAARAARESIVLLKNEAAPAPLLPLDGKRSVALIGDFAKRPRYQGAGSSNVNATQVESMEEMIRQYPLQRIGCEPGYRRDGVEDEELRQAALELAQKADIVLFCFGLDEMSEAEGMDRGHMRIPQVQIQMLEALVKVNPNIVGILSAGSAVEMPWHYSCKAILHGYLGGQAGAGAMLDVLTGRHNPSGRLSETYPIRYEDTPAFNYFPSVQRNSEYREGIFVGYRYYNTSRVRVQYPFGYGLSYTEFVYTDLQITTEGVTFTLTNTGKTDGSETTQMYIKAPGKGIFCPNKELKGFRKVFLRSGESKKVKIPFDDKTFRYWNTRTDSWETEGGQYTVEIAASVEDVRLTGQWKVEGTTVEFPYDADRIPCYYSGIIKYVSDDEFEGLLGHRIPDGTWSGKIGKNDAICQLYYAKSGIARAVYRYLTAKKQQKEEEGHPDLNILFIYNMPFRAIAKMTHGAVNMKMVDGILTAVNGKFWKGLGQIIKGFFSNYRYNRKYEKILKNQEQLR